MSIWKKQLAQSIVPQTAPVEAAPAPALDANALFNAVKAALDAGQIPASSQSFVRDVLSFGERRGFTPNQEQALRNLMNRIEAGSADQPLAVALFEAIPSLNDSDARFAQSLLDGFKRYGSFTDRQRPHVERLVRSVHTVHVAPVAPVAIPVVSPTYPNLCKLVSLDGFARFTVGKLQFSLKNDGGAIWAKFDGVLFGVIDPRTQGFRALTRGLDARTHEIAVEQMDAVEADPKGQAAAHGIGTGRCSCCGRPLTDPTSIAIGIGPICLDRAGW